MGNELNDIDELLETPCYVIDYLPQVVPENSRGDFFDVESYLLSSEKRHEMKCRYVNIILKWMCYYHMTITGNDNLRPIDIENAIAEVMENPSEVLHILLPDERVLIIIEGDSLHFTLYNVPEGMKELIERISLSEGFFFRKGIE